MWQVQIVGTAQNAFGYQVLAAAREALGQHPNQDVRTLQDVEARLGVRLVLGGPPVSGGRLDVDGVGVQPWRTVLYAMGQDVRYALDFVHLVLAHKAQKGAIARMPHLAVHFVGRRAQNMTLPGPWQKAVDSIHLPPAFAALPPKGRRHVLCQLEWKSGHDEEDSAGELPPKYVFSVFGNAYPFRTYFDGRGIAGAQLEESASGDTRQYVRYVEFESLDQCTEVVGAILIECLHGLPVFFVNMVSADDPVAQWLLAQESVERGEDAF